MRAVESSRQVGRVPCTVHSWRPLRDDWLQGQINMQANQQGAALLLVLEGFVFKIRYGFRVDESLGVNRPLLPQVTAHSGPAWCLSLAICAEIHNSVCGGNFGVSWKGLFNEHKTWRLIGVSRSPFATLPLWQTRLERGKERKANTASLWGCTFFYNFWPPPAPNL